MTIMRREPLRGGSSRGRLGSGWERIDSSFWFIPALLTIGAVILFFVTQFLDQLVNTNLAFLPIVFGGGATTARSVLSTVAGSLITVIATVFSLTVVTLQLASSSYTPRILRTFTSDGGVQTVLGTYIATFVYSLLVLRIVRTSEGEGGSFSPVISMTVAVVLALVCVALLIYFVAHIVNLIQSSTIVQMAHVDTMDVIAGLDDLETAPEEDPAAPEDRPDLVGLLAGEPLVVQARKSGYVQYVDAGAIVGAVAGEGGGGTTTVVEIPFAPGAFVAAGLPLIRVWPARESVSKKEVHDAFYFGQERTFQEDFAFGLRQLSDIALRGLSPGVNDPTTAMQAMDRMEAILVALAGKALPPQVREEALNGTRVLMKIGYYDFDDVVGLAFDQIRRASFTSGQVAVFDRLLEILDRVIRANELPERRRALWARVFTVARLAPEQVSDPEDAVNLVLRAVEIGAYLIESGQAHLVEEDLEDLSAATEDLRGGERVREAVRAAQLRPDARAR